MTQTNDTTTRDGRAGKPTPEQIEAEIHQTKSAIAGEIKALGEKMNPEHLREGARHIIQDVKEEAQDVIREAKTAAADSMRTAKEHAMESVNETLDEVSARARRVTDEVSARAHRITDATTSFVSENAIPLTLLGIGAGWLVMSMRRQREYSDSYRRVPTLNTYYSARRQGHVGEDDGFREQSSAAQLVERGKEAVGRVAERAKESGAQLVERAQEGAHQLGDRAVDLSHRAGEQLGRAQQRTTEFAHENPLAIGALAVAAGVGIGLALPSSRAENRLMGATRDRLAREVTDSAQQAARTARGTLDELKQTAKGTVDELKSSLSQPATFR